MDYIIRLAELEGAVEQAIDDALGKATKADRIILDSETAAALLEEFDELRGEQEAAKPRLLHVLAVGGEQLVRVEAISCVAVHKDGSAMVVFAGGGVVPFDAHAWHMLFSHIRAVADIEMVAIAPSKPVSQA